MKTIVLTKEREAARTEIQRAEAALREAVDKLHSISELDVPSNLGNIVDADWLREQLGNRIALVRADKSLTAAERETRLAPWRAIKGRAERAVLKIDGILNDWPELDWQPDPDGLNYHLADEQVETLATQKATTIVPPLAEQHWELIVKMREDVKRLRAFERENYVADAPLNFLARMTESQLYQAWISRDILLSSRTIGGKVIAPQKITNDFF